MKHFGFLSLLLLLVLSPTMVQAQIDDLQARTSIDYMMDDGKMSPAEMGLEAQYIHDLCNSNDYQRTYYDCACLAGAFLIQREKEGPYMPQSMLVERITQGPSASCANTVAIAGSDYESCMDYSMRFREFEKDNEEYCTCVANYTANSFTKRPYLSTGYIESMKSYAMTSCKDPAKRPKKAAETNNSLTTPRTLN